MGGSPLVSDVPYAHHVVICFYANDQRAPKFKSTNTIATSQLTSLRFACFVLALDFL